MKLLLRYARSYLLWFIALVLLIVVQGCAQLFGLTREMKNIVDQGIQTGDMNYIMHSGLRMLVFTALVAVCGALIAWIGGRISCGMRKDMMRDCYKKILSFSPQDEAGFGGATLLTRCITDTENIQRLLGFVLGACLLAPVVIILMLCSLFLVEKQVFVAEIVAVSVSFLIMIVLIIRARKRFPLLQHRLDRLNLITKEKITGVRTIRSFGREDYEEERGRDANESVFEADVAANRPLKYVSPAILTIMNLSMVFIYLTGAQKTADGLMKISTLLLTIQYVNSLIPSLSVLPIVFNMVPGAGTGLARIGELMDYRETCIPDQPADSRETGSFSLSSDPIVSFEHVSFGYEGHKTTLADLSFEIPNGSRIGVVGATGSGKSTLLMLMCGLCRPQEGRILAGGAPLDQLKKDTRMSIFSYVPQKAMVFQDSARENILAYHDGIDEEAVRRACDAAVFTEVAGELENGLDTVMAQGGMNLSGGQRKRLSLARGLAKEAAVYLLDDPFAALDAVTARAARSNTMQLLKGKTVVMVAQRFSQVMDFDRIIMMSQGRIAAMGTHEELLDGCSEYADMFRIQCSLESETEAL